MKGAPLGKALLAGKACQGTSPQAYFLSLPVMKKNVFKL
jgi:hypothetical protein